MTSQTAVVPDFLPERVWPGETGMSNCDHEIEEGFEQHLREGGWGRHAGWNFNGLVWFSEDAFHEQVWVYGAPVAVITEPTLTLLMESVSDEYGWE